jgi:hypothetical protein
MAPGQESEAPRHLALLLPGRLDAPQARMGEGLELVAVQGKDFASPSHLVGDSLTRWLGLSPQLKILQPVVITHAVDVVDVLRLQQGAANVLSHHETMLRNGLPVHKPQDIAALMDVPQLWWLRISGRASATLTSVVGLAQPTSCRLAVTSLNCAIVRCRKEPLGAAGKGIAVSLETVIVLSAPSSCLRWRLACWDGANRGLLRPGPTIGHGHLPLLRLMARGRRASTLRPHHLTQRRQP